VTLLSVATDVNRAPLGSSYPIETSSACQDFLVVS
jgi:hypothetical protein